MKKRLFTLCLALTAMCASTMAQFITEENFPDPNFRKFLIENIDGIKGDRFLSDSEKSAVTELNVSNQGIKDLTGIEYFTKLEILFCYGNDISSANMTKLVNLLPETDYAILVVNYVGCNPDNVITKAQAKIAEDKGWIVYRCLNDEDFELYDGEDISLTTATFFPDANFRSCLAAYDTNGDNVLSDTELNVVTALDVRGQGIKDLTGIEYFTNMWSLNCEENLLTTLDVSKNKKLTYLSCWGNNIRGAGMEELAKSLPIVLSVTGVDCEFIVGDDASNPDNVITTGLADYVSGKGWIVEKYYNNSLVNYGGYDPFPINDDYFPDAIFRQCVADKSIDTNQDGYLDEVELLAVKELDVWKKSITSLTGIEYFTALTKLDCGNNSLQSLDVSKNKALTYLFCSSNSLKSLDVTKNTALETLYCQSISIESLDVSKNKALKELHCDKNSLTSLDLSKNTALTKLFCKDNKLKQNGLDVSKNTALDRLDCSGNGLKSLDLSKNTALTSLDCSHNSLESLDVSKNTALTYLDCGENGLKSLDVSKNTALKSLNCSYNSLESLDVSKNTALESLKCSGNSLKSLDLSKNTALTSLDCSRNSLESLNVSKNIALTKLFCDYNSLESLDVSKNTALTQLFCSYNGLKSLDLSKNTALTFLDCNHNSLESLDVSNCLLLYELDCYHNSLTSLNVSNNTALLTLECGNTGLKSLDVSNCLLLDELYCYNNSLTSLDVSQNTALTQLNCSGNRISGATMTNLVNSLRSMPSEIYGYFFVCDDVFETDNIITPAQVSIATGKGWIVKKWMKDDIYGSNYAGFGDVNGDDYIDQYDLDTIVNIIMGLEDLYYAGDLNKDGKTDAADIVVTVNILNGK